MSKSMDIPDAAACVTYESGIVAYEELPEDTDDPVWVLGEKYETVGLGDRKKAKKDIASRVWITYRRGFPPIGGTGPTSDTGWGCMLRCGQMMLAQALICRHLGRDWRWQQTQHDDIYFKILRMFLDKKDSPYSIHQIAQMGIGEGKSIGQWFGPNTVSQVIRKLCAFDEWSDVAVHVALDNTVVIEDIKTLCISNDVTSTPSPKGKSKSGKKKGSACSSSQMKSKKKWKPLVLFIPLRLGLNEINSVYVKALKKCFTLSQTLGVIGGKPNHAHWFIGCVGDLLLYLDPHTTQIPVVEDKWGNISDDSYHCYHSSTMQIKDLDPSIALGFFCKDENDFENWCEVVSELVTIGDHSPVFELTKSRPLHWPPFEAPGSLDHSIDTSSMLHIDNEHIEMDSDDEFEIINP
ncbi:cysteine protease ATG4B-like isoform X2 [Anneissia japonica]|uniref:cysteine protease ATG4B-like isoform X2 n=1 Tax=Anneissia japonica TaxID=1529436 RepID=UPI0014258163|nr:cysteine protease ATG4B-like isoform X2 [Anneissia japonica]